MLRLLLALMLMLFAGDVFAQSADSYPTSNGDFDDFSSQDDAGWLSDVLWNFFTHIYHALVQMVYWLINAALYVMFTFLVWLITPLTEFLQYLSGLIEGLGIFLVGEPEDNYYGTLLYWYGVINTYLPVGELFQAFLGIAFFYGVILPVRILARYLVPGIG